MDTESFKNKYVLPKWVVNSFFILGIISATLMRSIIIFNHVNPLFVRLIWYMGIIGYTFFFAFRYHITHKRKRIIIDNNLIEKVEAKQTLNEKDHELLEYILLSVVRSKELFNYLYIFITSIIAIATDVVLNYLGI